MSKTNAAADFKRFFDGPVGTDRLEHLTLFAMRQLDADEARGAEKIIMYMLRGNSADLDRLRRSLA